MAKTLLVFLSLFFSGYLQGQKLLLQDYSFLLINGTVTKLHQSNDTLYELKCYVDRPCLYKPAKHYRVLSSDRRGDFVLLNVERLDTIPLTSDPYPAARYSVLAFKSVNDKQLGYLPLVFSVTKQQLDTIQINVQSLEDKFFFTYFSDNYLREFSALKKLTTKDEVSRLIEALKSDKYKPLAESYAKTETKDMYNAGLSAEILNRVCIENGYSPVGAGLVIEKLMK